MHAEKRKEYDPLAFIAHLNAATSLARLSFQRSKILKRKILFENPVARDQTLKRLKRDSSSFNFSSLTNHWSCNYEAFKSNWLWEQREVLFLGVFKGRNNRFTPVLNISACFRWFLNTLVFIRLNWIKNLLAPFIRRHETVLPFLFICLRKKEDSVDKQINKI